jgi:hypothetical protein
METYRFYPPQMSFEQVPYQELAPGLADCEHELLEDAWCDRVSVTDGIVFITVPTLSAPGVPISGRGVAAGELEACRPVEDRADSACLQLACLWLGILGQARASSPSSFPLREALAEGTPPDSETADRPQLGRSTLTWFVAGHGTPSQISSCPLSRLTFPATPNPRCFIGSQPPPLAVLALVATELIMPPVYIVVGHP